MSGTGRTIPIGAAELRAIRERESVLEQTLARLTGVDTATVERIENGETPLSTLEPDQIRQWAKTLGVNPARLTGETPQEGEGAITVIRRMRTERGWSCPQLAAHANVPYRSLRQYDSGERDTANMAAGILARVAIALDTSMEKLAGRPEPDHATDNPPAGWDGASPGTGRDKVSARPNSPSGPDRPRRPSEASRPAGGPPAANAAASSSTSPPASASGRSTSWTKHRKGNHAWTNPGPRKRNIRTRPTTSSTATT